LALAFKTEKTPEFGFYGALHKIWCYIFTIEIDTAKQACDTHNAVKSIPYHKTLMTLQQSPKLALVVCGTDENAVDLETSVNIHDVAFIFRCRG
jgi:hypothetical protein